MTCRGLTVTTRVLGRRGRSENRGSNSAAFGIDFPATAVRPQCKCRCLVKSRAGPHCISRQSVDTPSLLGFFLSITLVTTRTRHRYTVRSARALPVQLPFFGNHSHAPAHSSHVSHVPHASRPCPLSHLGPITGIPSALARVPTPLPASLISLFPLKTYLVPCFAE